MEQLNKKVSMQYAFFYTLQINNWSWWAFASEMEHTVWSAIFSQALGIEVGHFEEIFAPINPSYEAFFSLKQSWQH